MNLIFRYFSEWSLHELIIWKVMVDKVNEFKAGHRFAKEITEEDYNFYTQLKHGQL